MAAKPIGEIPERDKERFWEKAEKGDGCWLWTANKSLKGYGLFKFRNKMWGAHRFAWTLTNGLIPSGMYICHHCDRRNCVRPDHLFLGSQADNIADMCKKGRKVTLRGDGHWSKHQPEKVQRGEAHPMAKVTVAQILTIRQMRADGVRLRVIAKGFGLSETNVCAIVKRRKWKHV